MKPKSFDQYRECPRMMTRTSFKTWNNTKANQITQSICATYEDKRGINHIDESNMPQSEEIICILQMMLEVLFPGYTGRRHFYSAGLEFAIGDHINEIFRRLVTQTELAFAYRCTQESCEGCNTLDLAENACIDLLDKIPDIRTILKTDVSAALDGDPAAQTSDEVVIAYPGIRAIAIHRIAHELYKANVPLIPRVMSEYAHAVTGIDIHPGATIGSHFFIDHGTGVVVGETAILGKNIKIYQGVTLGALSFPKDERGQVIKGAKRHPNIEDNVTIYAGATILGDITIGNGSTIGGNVWLTESVDPGTRVTIAQPDLTIKTRKG